MLEQEKEYKDKTRGETKRAAQSRFGIKRLFAGVPDERWRIWGRWAGELQAARRRSGGIT